jgi:hypothetical protein
MNFPLDLWDISLFLAVTSVILLITSELLSPYYGKIGIRMNKKRLQNAAVVVSILFLATVAIRIITMILAR